MLPPTRRRRRPRSSWPYRCRPTRKGWPRADDVADPSSSQFDRFLTTAQVAGTFGARSETITADEKTLAADGMHLQADPTHGALWGTVTVAQVGQYFGTTLVDDDGTIEPDSNPRIPGGLVGVTGVVGLVASQPTTTATTPGTASPSCPTSIPTQASLAGLFGLSQILALGATGHGADIDVVAVHTFEPAVFENYNRCAGAHLDAGRVSQTTVPDIRHRRRPRGRSRLARAHAPRPRHSSPHHPLRPLDVARVPAHEYVGRRGGAQCSRPHLHVLRNATPTRRVVSGRMAPVCLCGQRHDLGRGGRRHRFKRVLSDHGQPGRDLPHLLAVRHRYRWRLLQRVSLGGDRLVCVEHQRDRGRWWRGQLQGDGASVATPHHAAVARPLGVCRAGSRREHPRVHDRRRVPMATGRRHEPRNCGARGDRGAPRPALSNQGRECQVGQPGRATVALRGPRRGGRGHHSRGQHDLQQRLLPAKAGYDTASGWGLLVPDDLADLVAPVTGG